MYQYLDPGVKTSLRQKSRTGVNMRLWPQRERVGWVRWTLSLPPTSLKGRCTAVASHYIIQCIRNLAGHYYTVSQVFPTKPLTQQTYRQTNVKDKQSLKCTGCKFEIYVFDRKWQHRPSPVHTGIESLPWVLCVLWLVRPPPSTRQRPPRSAHECRQPKSRTHSTYTHPCHFIVIVILVKITRELEWLQCERELRRVWNSQTFKLLSISPPGIFHPSHGISQNH